LAHGAVEGAVEEEVDDKSKLPLWSSPSCSKLVVHQNTCPSDS
jgi:hypothetical protein